MIDGQVSVFILPNTIVIASSPSVSDYLDSSGMCMYYILYNNVLCKQITFILQHSVFLICQFTELKCSSLAKS